MDLYTNVCYEISKILTKRYSTSFSLSTSMLDKETQKHIYAIYGMVRVADEIVDTYPKLVDVKKQLIKFHDDVNQSLKENYSSNPIIHSFAITANKFNITSNLIDPFFVSMEMDLDKKRFTNKEYEYYIYGSSEVVGLMCLRVFVGGDNNEYENMKKSASFLGSAYQKVNFLRDLRADYESLGRIYFPGLDFESFSESQKTTIVNDIRNDFNQSLPGMKKLPKKARLAVTSSYLYYSSLLDKIDNSPVDVIKSKRIRVSNFIKLILLIKARIIS
jgi:phytoene synthase